VSATVRKEQMALAIATLTSKNPPSVSRSVSMLAPLLWIALRAGIRFEIDPQTARGESRKQGSFALCLVVREGPGAFPVSSHFRYRMRMHPTEPTGSDMLIEELSPFPLPWADLECGLEDFSRWTAVAANIALRLWQLMHEGDGEGTSIGESLRETVRALSEVSTEC